MNQFGDNRVGLTTDFELDCENEEFSVIGAMNQVSVHYAGFTGKAFFAGRMKVKLHQLERLVAKRDTIGSRCCVELNGVPGVGDIDGERLVFDCEARHISRRFLGMLDVDWRFCATAFALVEFLADFAPVSGTVCAFVGPVVVGFGGNGEGRDE